MSAALLSMSHAELLAAAQAQAKRIAELEAQVQRLTEDRVVLAFEIQAEGERRLRRALRWAWMHHNLTMKWRGLAHLEQQLTGEAIEQRDTALRSLAAAQARLATLRRAPVQRFGPNLAGESWVVVPGAVWDKAVGTHALESDVGTGTDGFTGGGGTISRSSDSGASDAAGTGVSP